MLECQVPGCCRDLSKMDALYKRMKTCNEHMQALRVEFSAGVQMRFCHECGALILHCIFRV